MSDVLTQAATHRLRGEIPAALALVEAEFRARPTDVAVWKEFAAIAVAAKDYDRARAVLTALHEAAPQHPEPCYQLAALYDTLGEWETAMAWAMRAVHRIGAAPQGLTLAYALAGEISYKLGRPHDQGAKLWDRALLSPNADGPSMFAKAEILLARGRWADGWKAFEHRWRIAEQWRIQRLHQTDVTALPPEWDGHAEGRVLICAEQGTGDTLQFLRYLTGSEARDVVLQCQPELVPFVRGWMPWITCVPNGERVTADWSLPIMSLPYKLGFTTPLPPVKSARHGVAAGPLRVGVCWKGSPDHANDKDRSCPVNLLDVVRQLPHVEAVSLQHGEPTKFRDFAATAEVVASCDLVVTVDTAIFHLAGTLGVPTIVLPPTRPEFRFPLSDPPGQCCWYPGVTVVRRTQSDAWQPAIARVTHLIQERAHGV